MIDLHSHILPGMDDGSASFAESYMLARLYVRMGFEKVVATPHARAGELSLEHAWHVITGVSRLNARLRKRNIGLQVLSGMEVEFDTDLPEQIAKGTVLTLANGNYLLVETPFLSLPHGWEKLVFELGARGIKVIFAHPERCAQIAQSRGLAAKMAAAGAFLQVNWDSFLGEHGRDAARVASYLARHGLIHCLATDTHHAGSRDPGMVADAIEKVGEMMGERNLQRISRVNPVRVVNRLDMMEVDGNAIHNRNRSSRSKRNSLF